MRLILFMTCMLMLTGISVAQSSGGQQKNDQRTSDNSLAPYYPSESQGKKAGKNAKRNKKKNTPSGPTYQSEQDYYERMARLTKEKRKIEKEMEKPQYSNPLYFGHKRPPKKRKAGKLKFCKECGIRH